MTGEDEYFYLERTDSGQLLFSTPKKTAAMTGGVLVLFLIVGTWYFFLRPGSALHGASRLGLAAFGLLLLVLAAWNFYMAVVGRSILIDGKTKLVAKNGERLTGFGGVQSVELDVGYHPSINFAGTTYALSLRLKSGERVTLDGLRWRTWRDLADSDTYESNDEHAAERLDEIADEIAALMGVRVMKKER